MNDVIAYITLLFVLFLAARGRLGTYIGFILYTPSTASVGASPSGDNTQPSSPTPGSVFNGVLNGSGEDAQGLFNWFKGFLK